MTRDPDSPRAATEGGPVTLARVLAHTRAALDQVSPPPMAPRVRAALAATRAAAGAAEPAAAGQVVSSPAVDASAAGGALALPVAPGPMAATRCRTARPAGRHAGGAWGWAVAGLVALLAALWGAGLLPGAPVPVLPTAAATSGFVPVVPFEQWQRLLADAPGGTAWLVSAELPRDRLAALGLPFDPARAGDAVPAELLLHPTGEVLAVRVLDR